MVVYLIPKFNIQNLEFKIISPRPLRFRGSFLLLFIPDPVIYGEKMRPIRQGHPLEQNYREFPGKV